MKQQRHPLGRVFLLIDKIIEGWAIGLLVFLIVNVFAAVIMRRFFGNMFSWSEEVSLLCLTWFSFMGIAIGFREELHLGMDLFEKLPARVIRVWDRCIDVVVLGFGVYLVWFGAEFTLNMSGSTLPMTGWPNMVQYIVMPITGVLTCVYSVLRLLGYDLRRYHTIDDEIKLESEETRSQETRSDV